MPVPSKVKVKGKSSFIKPWCTNDPRACAKTIGLVQICVSVAGMLLLVCVPLTVIDISNEIAFIKDHHTGASMDQDTAVHRDYLFNLNITFNGSYDCDTITLDIQSFLTGFLVLDEGLALINFTVERVRVETIIIQLGFGLIRKQFICEVHVYTQADPDEDAVFIQDEQRNYSISHIVALAIANRTSFEVSEVFGMMTTKPPHVYKAVRKTTYPGLFGNDTGRRNCITNMIEAEEADAGFISDTMYNMLTYCGTLSTFIGCLYISASARKNRSLLSVMFFLEIIAISFIIIALVLVNHPLMCLLEHGGISVFGMESFRYMQTTITCMGVIYLVFKVYSAWFLAAYADAVYSTPRHSKSTSIPTAVSSTVTIATRAPTATIATKGHESGEHTHIAPTVTVKTPSAPKVEAGPVVPTHILAHKTAPKEVPKEPPKETPKEPPKEAKKSVYAITKQPVAASPHAAPPHAAPPHAAPPNAAPPHAAPAPAVVTDVDEIHKGMTEFFKTFRKESSKDIRKDLHKDIRKDVHKDMKEVNKDVRKNSKDKDKHPPAKSTEPPAAAAADHDSDEGSEDYDDDEEETDSPADGQPLRSRDLRRKKKSAAAHAAGMGGGSKAGRGKPGAGKGLFSSWW